jgi:hypothetical protein
MYVEKIIKASWQLHVSAFFLKPSSGCDVVDFVIDSLQIQSSSNSQPEDGFRKKAETCSCHDVLIIF